MTETDPFSSLTGRNVDVATDMIRQILTLADESAQSFDDDMAIWNHNRSCAEATVLSVWGDRGMGKSSVLASVTEKLISIEGGRFCVIGPIQPELFGATDTVLNIALALLEQAVIEQSDHFPDEWDADRVGDLRVSLERAQLTATVTRASQKVLAEASLGVDEFGRQLQRVASATAQMWTQICEVVSFLFHSGKTVKRHLVIVVDDPDLAPWRSSKEALLDIHNLGTVPGVIVLTGGKRENTRPYVSTDAPDSTPERAYPFADFQDDLVNGLKVFPLWGAYYLTPPSWSERVSFTPPGESESLIDLLEQCTSFSSRDKKLLPRIFSSYDSFLCGSPLPSRLRSLAQLWKEFSLRVKSDSDAPSIQAHQPESARRLCNQLLDNVEVPDKLKQNFAITWGAQLNPDSLPRCDIETLPLCSSVAAAGGFLSTAGAFQQSFENSVEFSLRQCARAGFSWWGRDNRPDARPDDLAVVLAIQEILWDSGLFDVDDESSIMAGFRPPNTNYLQKTSIHGQDTDDYLITFPLVKTWSSMKPAVHAWNGIVNRWKQESLSLRQVLSLSITAALHLTDDDLFDLNTADVDYSASLEQLQTEVKRLAQLPFHTYTLAQLELCNWYIAFLPAHWHASLFSPEEISEFTSQWRDITPLFCAPNSARIYRNWGLADRLGDLQDQCHDAGQARKFAWLGGYEQTVDQLELNVPEPAFTLVKTAWARLITTEAMAKSTGVIETSPISDSIHSDTDASDSPEVTAGGFTTGSNPTSQLATYPEDFGDRLMQAALAAIDQWRDSASASTDD